MLERFGKAGAVAIAVLAAALIALAPAKEARAHAGHDHGEAAPAVRGDLLPRATTHTDLFEIVVVAAEGRLVVFLDSYVGNTPITGAEVELLIDGELGEPSELAPGIYAFPWTPPDEATRFELTAIVTAESGSDLLLADLELPPAAEEPMQAVTALGAFTINLQTLVVLIAFLLGAAAAYLMLQRQRQRPDEPAPAAALDPEGDPQSDHRGSEPRLSHSGA